MSNAKIKRTDAWLKENEGESFAQAVVAVKRLHEFTPFVANLIYEEDQPNAARSYLSRVLYGPNLLANAPDDEVGALRARLAFTEDIVEAFFRIIIKRNFAHEYGTEEFDSDPRVAYALERASAQGLRRDEIRVGFESEAIVSAS